MVGLFLSGVTAAMFLVAGTFFLKFWQASRNRFFGLFAAAFMFFSVERLLSLYMNVTVGPDTAHNLPDRWFIYILRLIGFVCILTAIIDRNRCRLTSRKKPGP